MMEHNVMMEALTSLYEYLPKLTEGVRNTVDYLRKQQTDKGFNLLPQVFEGLQWSVNVIHYTKDSINSHGFEFDGERMKEVMSELMEAMECDDIVSISDILEYEITDILEELYGQLKVVLNKGE